jgi:ABC-type transport system involved in cytochrome c biogenesis permease subunit
MMSLWSLLTGALYAGSLVLYALGLARNVKLLGRLGSLSLAAALLSHFQFLMLRARALESVPYQDLYGSVSLFAWFLGFTYLGVERFHRQRAVAPIVLPFVMLFYVISALLSQTQVAPQAPARGPLFALHVTSNVLAYAAFAVAFVMCTVFLVQNHVLRRRKVGTMIWQFPALEELERMSRTSVTVGVVALAVGMSLGSVWAHRLHGSYWTSDPKEIVSVLILVAYVAYLVLSHNTAWRGARASWWCVCSFLLVVFSFTFVNLFLSEYHRFV